MTTISEDFARFALGPLSLPDSVRNIALTHFLDTLGVAIASSGFEFAEPAYKAAEALGKGGNSQLVNRPGTLPAASAALANGILAHGLDFDDTHVEAIYHASCSAFATALAVGEEVGATGQQVLEAYIVALEIGSRIALAGKGEFHDRGLHPTAICASFPSAAAAARLRGLTETQLVDAMGLCGSQAGGIFEIEGCWLKRMHPGWAAHSGIAAASLGQAGFKGPKAVFEGKLGFYAVHLGRVPPREDVLGGLGESWALEGLGLKPYPCCHFTHAFADAALAIRAELGGAPDPVDIARITAPLTHRLHHLLDEPKDRKRRPQTEYDGLFSTAYVVGLALARGEVTLSGFYDGAIFDETVLALSEMVTCVDDPESDYPVHFPGALRVEMKDGRVFEKRVPQSSGTPGMRLTDDEIVAKFTANATRMLPAARAEALAATVMDLGGLARITDLLPGTHTEAREAAE